MTNADTRPEGPDPGAAQPGRDAGEAPRTVVRLTRVCLITHDAQRLADFYRRAFNCGPQGGERLSAAATEQLIGVSTGAHRVRLVLGAQHLELLQLDIPGRAYPAGVVGSDPRFQHFAIVVEDMSRAYRHLVRTGGWQSISTHGPQRLPASSGGVTAFKFRDPDGHPLELLWLGDPAGERAGPAGRSALFPGIDHSAICVRDSARSIAFYERWGLRVSARTLNHGHEQQQLDGLVRAQVQVVALSPREVPPHLELLCYQDAVADDGAPVQPDDVAATRLVFETDGPRAQPRHLRDPDGHHLVVC